MGRLYIYLFMVDVHGKLIGVYTSPMDLMGGPKASYKWSEFHPYKVGLFHPILSICFRPFYKDPSHFTFRLYGHLVGSWDQWLVTGSKSHISTWPMNYPPEV